jgi:hypothetical protein
MTGNKEVEDLIEEKVVDFYMSMSTGQPKRQGKVPKCQFGEESR